MKMPQEIKTKWLAALRSGEYKQTDGTLYDEATKGYCCLGVLQMVCDGKVEMEDDEDGSVQPMTFPTGEWFKDHGILLNITRTAGSSYISAGSDQDAKKLVDMNDGLDPLDYGRRYDFKQIADYIEESVEGVPSE